LKAFLLFADGHLLPAQVLRQVFVEQGGGQKIFGEIRIGVGTSFVFQYFEMYLLFFFEKKR